MTILSRTLLDSKPARFRARLGAVNTIERIDQERPQLIGGNRTAASVAGRGLPPIREIVWLVSESVVEGRPPFGQRVFMSRKKAFDYYDRLPPPDCK